MPPRCTSYIVLKALGNLNLIYVVIQVTQRCKKSKETIFASLKRHSKNKGVLNTSIPAIFQFEKSSYRQETDCENEHTSNNSCRSIIFRFEFRCCKSDKDYRTCAHKVQESYNESFCYKLAARLRIEKFDLARTCIMEIPVIYIETKK